ncbi:MAG: tRNA (N6-threonylcarbamoyladenosine(37)-N6)-methyltransferase TrmO [Planctomycetota bacterium]
MNIEPVGQVRKRSDKSSVLDIRARYADALLGIEPGDRLQVLYWMHRLPDGERERLQVHPQGRTDRPLRGVFAVRSPMRPNPIGVAVVTVTEVDGTSVAVSGLDAFDGSPIIDVKSG